MSEATQQTGRFRVKQCLLCGAMFSVRAQNAVHAIACPACRRVHKLQLKRQRYREAAIAVSRGVDNLVWMRECTKAMRREQRDRKAELRRYLAARDRAFESAGFPSPKIEVHDGVRVETRGQSCIAPHFSQLVAVHHKSYYYR